MATRAPGRSGEPRGVHTEWATTLARLALLTVSTLLIGLISAADSLRAASALPDQIALTERVRLELVVKNAVVSTRRVVEPFPGRPAIFEYLLDHPEFATHVARALRVARYRIWRTGEGLFLDDGWGAKGHFEVVHVEQGIRVFYAHGHYEQRLLPNIRGRAVVVIEYGFSRTGEGGETIAAVITGYVMLDNRALRLIGKLAAPVAQAKADREAQQLLKVFARVSRAIADSPDRVYDELRRRPDVPRQELEEFRRLLPGP